MPTPEASLSSPPSSPIQTQSMAPNKNANNIESAIEEVDSFKAKSNVSIMTQIECLDNGHQATGILVSNECPTNDKVSDDLNNSKNSVVSNGVNSVQEFNVDVNREQLSTDSVIVQDHTVDTDSPPTGKVSPPPSSSSSSSFASLLKSEHSTEKPNFLCADSKENFENQINKIDANKSEYSDMTVIKHQNSGENIRDIIANSEKANKNASDSQIVKNVEKNLKSDVISNMNSRNIGTRRSRRLVRSENVKEGESDQPEDPIERLNKLRASISSALSEVKGVLKQYSTDQSVDEPAESAPSSKPASDDGPVRFRFVRKIRRRSVFSEDDETEIPKQQSIDLTTSPIIENKLVEETSNEGKDIPKSLSNEEQESSTKKNNEKHIDQVEIKKNNDNQEAQKLIDEKTEPSEISVVDIQKTTNEDSQSAEASHNTTSVIENETKKTTKCVKTKKVLKKDRRASIAAVEVNQLTTELKPQRRPSDSGTLVKQATRIKAKTLEKSKANSSRKVKNGSISKTDNSSVTPENSIEHKVSPLTDETKIVPEIVSVTDNQTKLIETSNKSIAPTVSVSITPSEKESETPVIEESKLVDNKIIEVVNTSFVPLNQGPEVADLCPDVPVLLPAILKSNEPEVVSTSLLETSIKEDLPSTSTCVTESESSAENTVDQVATSEVSQPDISPTEISPPKVSPIEESKTDKTSVESEVESPSDVTLQEISSLPEEKATLIDQSLSSTNVTDIKEVSQSNLSAPISAPEPPDTNVGVVSESYLSSTVTPSPEPTETSKSSNKFHIKPPEMPINPIVPSQQTLKMVIGGRQIGTPSHPTPKHKQPTIKQKASQLVKTFATTASKTVQHAEKKKSTKTEIESEVPLPSNVPKDAIAVKLKLPGQQSVEELQKQTIDEDQTKETSPSEATQESDVSAKKKRKAKRKVVIRRIKRKLSKDDTFISQQEGAAELEIEEKEIADQDQSEDETELENRPKQPKSCLKSRTYEIGDTVMYAEHYKKTQVRWKKAIVMERITSISYKLNIEGVEKPAHISYIKKFTDRKVNFGGKEYLEIDYEKIEEDEEKERNYSIWNHV